MLRSCREVELNSNHCTTSLLQIHRHSKTWPHFRTWVLASQGWGLPSSRHSFQPSSPAAPALPTSYHTHPSVITFVPVPLNTWISWASGEVTLVTPECTSDFHRKGLSFKSQGHMSRSKPRQRAACPEGTGKVQSGGGGAGGRDDRTRIQTRREAWEVIP